MKKLFSIFLAALFLSVAVYTPSFADGDMNGRMWSTKLDYNSTTAPADPVGSIRMREVTLGDPRPFDTTNTVKVANFYILVRATRGWMQGELLVLDTANVTDDTGQLRLRPTSPFLDTTSTPRNIFAIGQNVCDTSAYCWATYEGTETGLLISGTPPYGTPLYFTMMSLGSSSLASGDVLRKNNWLDTNTAITEAVSIITAIEPGRNNTRQSVRIR